MQLFSRFFYVTMIQTVGLGSAIALQPAVAQSCPYESYMIINGKCHEFSSIPQVKQPKVKTIRAEESTLDSYNNYNPNAKTCSDFNFQDEAQDYAMKHSNSGLKEEGDSIVCGYLPWRKYGYLNKYSYQEVKNEYYRRKQEQTFGFKDHITMSISEVQSIIGFEGQYQGNGTWVWGNILNPREEIKIKVLNNQIVRLSKKGF